MAKLIHTMIRVLDLDKSLAFYRDVLDMKPSHTLEFPDFALVYLRNNEDDAEIELTYNKGRTEPYTHGTGYGHVAAVVEDLDARHAAITKARLCAAADQGVQARRRATRPLLLRPGP